MGQSRSIYILWGRQLDAVAATIFITELRRVGLSARLLGLQTRPTRSQFGLVLIPDLSIDTLLNSADAVDCLIMPGQWKDVQIHLYDPRLLDLINRIHREKGLVYVGGRTGQGPDFYTDGQLLSYPQGERLLPFAQHLAHSLLNGLTPSFQPMTSEGMARSFQTDLYRTGDYPMGDLIRVAAESQPALVAGAIANTIREYRRAEVQAIGVSAVNQMMKAAIIARRYLNENQQDLFFVPDFTDVFINEKHFTALRLSVWVSDQSNDGHDGLL